jgi:hypothetical protein
VLATQFLHAYADGVLLFQAHAPPPPALASAAARLLGAPRLHCHEATRPICRVAVANTGGAHTRPPGSPPGSISSRKVL